jgi:hypothetical protein
VKTYQCPADATISGGFSANFIGTRAASSYGANFQLFGTAAAGGNAHAPQYNVGNIPDGTSNTIAFAEVFGAWNNVTLNTGGTPTLTAGTHATARAYPGPSYNQNPPAVTTGGPYLHAAVGDSLSYAYPYQAPQIPATQASCDKPRSQSFHPGSVVVALADGSVRLVNSSITQTTWQNALTPADGNVLGPDW